MGKSLPKAFKFKTGFCFGAVFFCPDTPREDTHTDSLHSMGIPGITLIVSCKAFFSVSISCDYIFIWDFLCACTLKLHLSLFVFFLFTLKIYKNGCG